MSPFASTRPLLFIFILSFLLSISFVSSKKFIVGDEQRWAPNVNYTEWTGRHQFHVGDWLVFFYRKWLDDVIEVNETSYNNCDASQPIFNFSEGNKFAYQLKEPKNYYFICSKGYCYGGMKLQVKVEPLPSPAPAPAPVPVPEYSAGQHVVCLYNVVGHVLLVIAIYVGLLA